MTFGNENALGQLMFQGGLAHGGMTPPSQLGNLAMMQSPVAPGPAQNPEELGARAGGWNSILQKLSDPGMQSALLSLGTQLMQPVQPGQTGMGHAGAALQNTMAMQQTMQARKAAEAREKEKSALEGRRVTATERGVDLTERQLTEAERRAGRQEKQAERELAIKEEDAPVRRAYEQARTAYTEAQTKAVEDGKGTGAEGATLALTRQLAKAMMLENPERYGSEDAAFIGAYEKVRQAQGQSREQFLTETAAEMAKTLMLDLSKPGDKQKLDIHVEEMGNIWDSVNQRQVAPAAPTPAAQPAAAPAAAPGAAKTGMIQRNPSPEVMQTFEAAAASAGMQGVSLGAYVPQQNGWLVVGPDGQPMKNANGQDIVYVGKQPG